MQTYAKLFAFVAVFCKNAHCLHCGVVKIRVLLNGSVVCKYRNMRVFNMLRIIIYLRRLIEYSVKKMCYFAF